MNRDLPIGAAFLFPEEAVKSLKRRIKDHVGLDVSWSELRAMINEVRRTKALQIVRAGIPGGGTYNNAHLFNKLLLGLDRCETGTDLEQNIDKAEERLDIKRLFRYARGALGYTYSDTVSFLSRHQDIKNKNGDIDLNLLKKTETEHLLVKLKRLAREERRQRREAAAHLQNEDVGSP